MIHNEKVVFKLAKGGLKSRIVGLFGNSYNQKLLPVEQKQKYSLSKDLLENPSMPGKQEANSIFLLTNGL